MIYRKLRPDDATHDGDMYASPCVNVSGKLVKQVVSGCSEILRPIPDEPEDVVRVEGEVCDVLRCRGVIDQVNVTLAHTPVPLDVATGQRVTLLIPRPDPPVPKCPYCGMQLVIKHFDSEYWAECRYSNCSAVVRGKPSPTRREAIEAMTPKGGGQ